MKSIAIVGTVAATRVFERHRLGNSQPLHFVGEHRPGPYNTNCHGYAIGREVWFDAGWDPFIDGAFAEWVDGVPRSWHIFAWRKALKRLGFVERRSLDFTPGRRQIAVYADQNGYVTHSSLMIGPDSWESKIGGGGIVSGHLLVRDAVFGSPRYFFERSEPVSAST